MSQGDEQWRPTCGIKRTATLPLMPISVRRNEVEVTTIMLEDERDDSPATTAGDRIHALVKGTLGSVPLAGGLAAELFGMFVVSPYQRRLQIWIEGVAERLKSLDERLDVVSLANNETFVSTLIQATQAAVRTHRQEKILLLQHAVLSAATGLPVPADLQSTFVRYVDELTPIHFSLLGFLLEKEHKLRDCGAYHTLLGLFIEKTNLRVSPDEFRLLCNDLEIRLLVRFSSSMEDFTSAYRPSTLLISNRLEHEVMLRVTDIGRELVRFVGANGGSA